MSNKVFQTSHWINVVVLSAACLVLAACSNDESTGFCENHRLFHEEHSGTTASLAFNFSKTGEIDGEITIPKELLNGDVAGLIQVLSQPDKVYTLQTLRPCRQADGSISQSGDSVTARYQSECGADNKLEQLDVVLFDQVPRLNEVVVMITTPATSKRFAINRQCEKAVFRID